MATRTVSERTTKVQPIAAGDPLWFKDAVVYQLHVRSFYDSDDDGVGDFRGLTEKLDYIQDLGVTAIWLLPFFPSPLRDDGYDIADYTSINPAYGTLRDFKRFLREAHRRDLRVITELVMNHTSDQHRWFQKSRRARPATKWRDFYVWSDTTERYSEARTIFQDFEASNWTWDPVAGAYYWHRFYSHQPDLNFDNPDVHEAMFRVIDFWMEMGVDGMRLDAVPYLYEREGTNCENLPETHAFLKALRQHVEKKFADKMLLAEANQWPEDAVAYFGDGDECHMNFHFPLMPRLFMAVEREDRFPIWDILDHTPEIPANCQWAIFLRNHDELTLEMVTDEERDYMYRAYAEDSQARVNLGIRRRLAPLLRNNRRKLELMNALLLSLPGTPIVYYGDELGMGDNIYLGDRHGVRTPMQWNADRNAGFSRTNPQKLVLPAIIDAEYHYSALNVEVEQNSPHSILWWMRRVINLRKQFLAFGRGRLEFLTPENPKVLAYLRQYNGETLLVVANLSRFAQCAELDLARYRGQTPVELFGQTRFPPIGELPYFLTLGPYAFYWFRLSWPVEEAESLGVELPSCTISGPWDNLLAGRPRTKLEQALPGYLMRQRWFAGKAQTIKNAQLFDEIGIPNGADEPALRLLLVQVNYVEGEPEVYLLPVIFAQAEQAANIMGDHPRSALLHIERSNADEPATLCEAVWEEGLWIALYEAFARRRGLKGSRGRVTVEQTKVFRRLATSLHRRGESDGEAREQAEHDASGGMGSLSVAELARVQSARSPATSATPGGGRSATALPPPTITVHGGEQSNTSVFVGDRFILKAFRRLSVGENPDLEIGRFLTGQTRLACVPKVAGALTYHPAGSKPGAGASSRRTAGGKVMTLGVLHELVPNEGDAWVYTLDELGRFFERAHSNPAGTDPAAYVPGYMSLLDLAEQSPPEPAAGMIGPYLQSAELLGRRTAELHAALSSGRDPAFAPEAFTKLYQRSLYQSLRTQARRVFALLKKQSQRLPDEAALATARVFACEADLGQRFSDLLDHKITALRTRCHGDYHLGQVLFTGKDFVIIDFEGEPARPISERRIKTSPLRDVAGMIRSFHYASHAAQRGQAPGTLVGAGPGEEVKRWLRVWYVWSAAAFLRAYLAEARHAKFLPKEWEELRVLLDAYLLEKAVYELGYELNNRPDWVTIPLEGILELVEGRRG